MLALEHLPEFGSAEYTTLKENLLQAADQGDLAVLQQVGPVAVHRMSGHSCTFMTRALRARHAHVVAWLVEESERTGLSMAKHWSSTHLAAFQGQLDKLRAASDEELRLFAQYGETVLDAAAMGDQGEVIEYLVRERGLDVEDAWCSRSPLEVASECGCVSAIEALVACGAELHKPGNPCGVMVKAIRHGQVAALEKLAELGADVTAVGPFGDGLIHAAAQYGQVDLLDSVVRLGADPFGVIVGSGRTALHEAAAWNKASAIERLVQLGLQLNGKNSKGETALHLASQSPEACRALLELGADRWIKDNDGCTARDCAVSAEFNQADAGQVVELLDTYWPIVSSMVQVLLGLRGPSESPLMRLAAHDLFEPNVLSLVNCLLTGKGDAAFEQLVEEC